MLWAALVLLLGVAQTLLVVLTLRYEESRAQDRADEAVNAATGALRQRAQRLLQGLQLLQPRPDDGAAWQREADQLLRAQHELGRVERRDQALVTRESADSPLRAPLFAHWPRPQADAETEAACANARRNQAPSFARSQFVPQANGLGLELIDVCVPMQAAGRPAGYLVATIVMSSLLDEISAADSARNHELSFVEPDGTRLARSGAVRGAGVFVADKVVDLPGAPLQLRVNLAERRPSLIPNLATALVLGLSLALFGLVLLLVRDGRRRAEAESRLADALTFRKAMEDSLITGLRARDRQGRIVHVNPAFCAMVGFSADELQSAAVPPYWPPEQVPLYQRRQAERMDSGDEPSREGYETEFMRRNGERFAVMVYEARLLDALGRHTGWMSTVLDISAQRRVEELSRQQQERLQATARLASVGEMASLLSHELNQPLAAITSYASGSLNLMDAPDDETATLLRQAMGRIAEQAERAGRVIRSVHDFVRRRQQAHEVIAADLLIESVLPLVALQARKSGARIEVDVARPVPRLRIDRTMVEQVLLNLARNGLQAMEVGTPVAERVLTLRVETVHDRWAAFSVIDAGAGIAPDVAKRLFTPFFTTRDEGMGLGLSLCRTVVEQHGGAIEFQNLRPHGTAFRFTLPLAPARAELA